MNTDRFKFRVWDIKNKRYLETLNGLYFKPYPKGLKALTWFIEQEDYIVEQCIGLKGESDELIYEGDLVRLGGYGVHQVIWSEDTAEFMFKNLDEDLYEPVSTRLLCDWEIIGNIHENMELSK